MTQIILKQPRIFLLGILFAFCSVFWGLNPVQAATTIKNLRVEYMKNPVGIDVTNPRFSWQMESDVTGMKQNAYEIILTGDEEGTNILWSSGKIQSDVSVGIKYDGASLFPSTRYYWTVNVWDKDDTKITSIEKAYFETGLLSSGWSGAKWLKIKDSVEDENPVNFTLECDMTVIDQNAGVIFGAKDANNMYMWAINTYGTANNQPALRRHIFTNGNVVYVEDVAIPFTTAQIIGIERHLKIEAVNNVIKTYLDGTLIDTYNSPALKNGYIGFRVYTGDNNTHEHAYIDNVIYNYYENGVLKTFTEDFENGSNDFDEANTIVVNGNTKMDLIANGNADFRVLQSAAQGIPMFRSEFALTKEIKSARIYSSGLGVYDLFINGKRVGTPMPGGTTVDDEFKPGWTDYRKTVLYSTYDITNLLTTGVNAIGAQVSSGWFTGNIAHNEYGQHPLAFMAKILLEYTDNTNETLVTNTADWKATTNSPIRTADIYDGETYDARRESNWATTGFDDSEWKETEINDYFTGDILAFTGQPVRVRHELERTPQTTTIYNGTKPNGTTYGEINVVRTLSNISSFALAKGETAIIDFGQNMVGWINFKLTGTRGTRLTARFAEMLNDSGAGSRGNDNAKGTLYLRNLRTAKATLRYLLKGDEQGETYNPTMTFFGFRYCEIMATDDVVFEYIKGEVVGNVNEENSTFVTNNELVNKLYSNVLWGQRGNFLSVPTDCPQRDERLGWLGDTQIFSRAAAYNADVASFFRKWIKDVRDSQQPDGTYPGVAPSTWNVGNGRSAWAEAGIIVPWNVYLMYNDKNILSDQYESMEKFMGWMEQQKFDGYLYNGGDPLYGDWLAYEETDKRFISVCYYAYVAQLMTKISKALSQSAGDVYDLNAAKYQTLYNNIKAEFQSRYFNPRTGLLRVITQTAYLLALKYDLFPDQESTNAAVTYLVTKIKNNGNKLKTGFVGTGILNQTLSEYGASDMAYNLLLQRNDPSWLYSVDQGATTIWERWNSYTIANGFGDPSMNSFNHYSYGAVSEWMYRYMAGIETDENNPGFKHFILQPTPDLRDVPVEERITKVDAVYASCYGDIKSKWEQKADKNFTYSVTIPANTTATLYILKTNGTTQIKQNGIPAKDVAGVISFIEEGNRFILELQSGSYTFDTFTEVLSDFHPEAKNAEVNIYPNPVAKGGNLYVEVNPENTVFSNAVIDVYSILGSLIANYRVTEKLTPIVMNENSGIYLVEFNSGDDFKKRIKIIVK